MNNILILLNNRTIKKKNDNIFIFLNIELICKRDIIFIYKKKRGCKVVGSWIFKITLSNFKSCFIKQKSNKKPPRAKNFTSTNLY